MKKITLLVCSFAVAMFASAANITVESPADYATAYAGAADGDVLLLYSGTYANQDLPTGKCITVKAFADTCEVFLTGEIRGGGVDGGITYDGVTIGDGASYLFNFTPTGHIKHIRFVNTTLQNVSRCTFYLGGDAATTALELVEFQNCVLRNLNTGNWNMSWHTTPIWKWVINESTLYGNEGMECFYNPRAATEHTFEFIFTHNTMYSGCRDANRTINNVSGNATGEGSVMTFTDNVILCPDGKSAGKLWDVRAGYWTVTVKNNLIEGWQIPVWNEDLGDAEIANNYTLTDLGLATPASAFADAANADFTLYKGYSALEGKGTEGSVLGDTEWLVEVSGLYTLTQGLAANVDSLAGVVSGPSGMVPGGNQVTLKAVKNYGYKFVKWVDATGTQLSTDAEYTFEMTGDLTVLAVFEKMNMYSLEITCKGGGTFAVSPARDGNLYEEGEEVVVTAQTNMVLEFIMGSDNAGEFYYAPEFMITMNKNLAIELEFEAKDYICGWDFDLTKSSATQQRPADWLSDKYSDTIVPTLDLYYTLYPDAPWTSGYWIRGDADPQSAVTWLRCTNSGDGTEYKNPDNSMDSSAYYKDQGFYWQTAVSTKAYKGDIQYSFDIKRTYMGHYNYKVQYSYDGSSWESAPDTIATTGGYTHYDVKLDNTANKELVYVRLIPDVNSGYDTNRFFDVYGVYVKNIFLIAEAKPVAIITPKAETKEMIFDLMGRRVMEATQPGLYIINGKKVLVK